MSRVRQLLGRKSLEQLLEEMAGDNRLKRALGPVALTALGVGSIIGAGIFVVTGRAASLDAGPAIVVSYSVAAIGCALAALCYAEFAAMAPVAGSAYTFAYATLGEIFAWIIGWDLILEYAMACATVASAWTGYLNKLLAVTIGVELPAAICSDPFTISAKTGHAEGFINLPAILITALVTAILVRGIKESANTNAALVVIKLAVVIFVIAAGWAYVDPANWTSIPVEQRIVAHDHDPASKWGMLGYLGINRFLTPIDDAARTSFTPYGLSGIMLGASIVFFAYIGFDSISTHAEEAKNPRRDVPIGILVSLGLCTILYIAVAAVITGMEPYPQIDHVAPIAAAFARHATDNPWLRGATILISAGALAGMTSVILVTFLSQVRIFLAMARDGLMPQAFGVVHPGYQTPHLSTWITGVVIAVVSGFTPIVKLEEMVNIGTLMAFVIVCASVLILRRERPEAARPFRCPYVTIVAPAGMIVNFTMMLFLPLDTWFRLFAWLAVGLVIYLSYGIWHSVHGNRRVATEPGA